MSTPEQPASPSPEAVARALVEQLRTWQRPEPPPIEPLEDDGRIA